MRLGPLLVVTAMAIGTRAPAGAWLQETGSGFFSLENTLRQTEKGIELETDIFAEYGISPRLSIGLTAFQQGGARGHTTLFVKTPIGPRDTRAKMSMQLDLGTYVEQNTWRGLGKLTFAYGRGFAWGSGYGWMNIETAVEYRQGLAAPFYKLDATIGRSSGARLRPMVKLSATEVKSLPLIWSVAPYLLIDGKQGLTWALGLERKSAGRKTNALRFGIWRKF